MRTLTALAWLAVVIAPALPAQGPAPKSAPLQWGPAPAVFPPGAKMAVVSGDPGKAGPFAVELAMPNGYKVPPHFHPSDERIEVRQGTLLVGMGDSVDAANMKPMKLGDTHTMPAGTHHFATARGATVIAVSAQGPFGMTYVHAADDPLKPAAQP